MWSVGVIWLELVMGTPHVFQIAPRTAALLNQQLQSDNKDEVRNTQWIKQGLHGKSIKAYGECI